MLSNLFPGIISPFSPHLAYFSRAVGSGLADNYVPGQTVAEMFNIPTEYPVYLTVVVPSNCLVYDTYGLHQEDGHFTYSFARAGVPGAIRLDDLHPDSLVVIINYGEISGAGGDGGMGEQGYYVIDGQSTLRVDVGSGGGGGRGRAGTKGGMRGDGGDWPIYARWIYSSYTAEPDTPDPMTVLDGGDGDEDGPGLKGGTRDFWSYARGAGTWTETKFFCYELADDLATFNAGFDDWPNASLFRDDWQHERAFTSKWGWFFRYPDDGFDLTPTPSCIYTDVWKNLYEGVSITPEIPGYDISNKAIFKPQDGTAAIVLGCKTYIYNSTAVGSLGYIFGGGGGGVGGDRNAGTGFGFDGGDWGADGGGPNWQGHNGGVGGKAVEVNGQELTWIDGYLPGTQVKGSVS